MGVEFRKCLPGHLVYIEAQRAQKHSLALLLTPEYAEMATSYISLSAWEDGKCIGAAGIVPVTKHKAMAWAMLSERAGAYMLPIVRKIREVVNDSHLPRIEMTVDARFVAGQKLAHMIGMVRETPEPMKFHGASGEDEYMYSRTRS